VHSFVPEAKVRNEFDFTLSCSSGTYVRSIASDLGHVLGVGGHLLALRRTRIGDLDVEKAWNLEALSTAIESAGTGQHQRS
jgi:tRNA pseudouridine55 synthase